MAGGYVHPRLSFASATCTTAFVYNRRRWGIDPVIKVVDNGTHGSEVWRSRPDDYAPGLGQKNFNVLLATIGANGVYIQAGASLELEGYRLPLKVGVGLLDRETGKLRYFAEGLEESIAAMNSSPDGSVYLGFSPLRRAVSYALFGKFGARRLDLLIRDAACAASDRALDAFDDAGFCPDSAEADIRKIQNLITRSGAPP